MDSRPDSRAAVRDDAARHELSKTCEREREAWVCREQHEKPNGVWHDAIAPGVSSRKGGGTRASPHGGKRRGGEPIPLAQARGRHGLLPCALSQGVMPRLTPRVSSSAAPRPFRAEGLQHACSPSLHALRHGASALRLGGYDVAADGGGFGHTVEETNRARMQRMLGESLQGFFVG